MIFLHAYVFLKTLHSFICPAAARFRAAAGLLFLIWVISGCSSAPDGPADEPSPPPLPMFEIFPQEESGAAERYFIPPADRQNRLPRVAIIIDDIGYDRSIVRDLLSLNEALTFSVLPGSPYADAVVRDIHEQKREIMLHLPMEPVEYPRVDPGPGALLMEMGPDEMTSVLVKNLDAVPFIKGVNNHMGSKITQMPVPMFRILSAVKARQLFFIDSVTSQESICSSSARAMQIPFARRDVFLDHVQSPEVIRRQLFRLASIAEIYGEAIGIGHPHTVTFKVLQESLPEFLERVEIVPASLMVHTIG